MENIAVAVGLLSGLGAWWALAFSMKVNRRPWWWRHLAGMFIAPFAVLGISTFLAGLGGGQPDDGDPLGLADAAIGLILAIPAAFAIAVSWRAARRRKAAEPATKPPSQDAEGTEPSLQRFQGVNRQAVSEALSSKRWKQKARKAKHHPVANSTTSKPSPNASSSTGNLRFRYEDAKGDLSTREVSSWSASSYYIKGICVVWGETRTFRRDRVLQFLDGSETLLAGASIPRELSRQSTASTGAPEILFTGFDSLTREQLESQAAGNGMKVRKSLTQNLGFLCTGPNAGPSKVAQAADRGITILDEKGFYDFLTTGAVSSQ